MKQVLIVDDESRLLQSIETGLQKYSDIFSVLTAENGKTAIEILSSTAIDLVVTDLRMPELDGFELLAHMSTNFPFIQTVVMTAFATPDIEERLNKSGNSVLLEKPIDFQKLADTIIEGLSQERSEDSITGFSLVNFLQLLGMEKKTCLLNVSSEEQSGYIFLDQGEIFAAVTESLKGEEALYVMLSWSDIRITFKKQPKRKITRIIDKPLMSLLIEGSRLIDEMKERERVEKAAQSEKAKKNDSPVYVEDDNEQPLSVAPKPIIKGDEDMAKLDDMLGKLGDVEGFMAAGVFTPNGEMAAQANSAGIKLAEIGSLANDVLLKAQKATDVMNVGRGKVVHIDAPNAHIIARCHNESDSFDETTAGKAHIHMVMLLKKEGNLAMAKIKLDSLVNEIAAEFR